MSFADFLGYSGGILTSISLVTQVYKSWREKSARDLGWPMLGMNSLGCLFIMIYGILIQKPATYLTIFITLLCFLALMIMKWMYHGFETTYTNSLKNENSNIENGNIHNSL